MSMKPGWYTDQGGEPLEREWDGQRWTGATRPRRESVASAVGNGLVSPADRSVWKSITSTVWGRLLMYVVVPLGALLAFAQIAILATAD